MSQIPKCTLVPTRYLAGKDPRCFLSEVTDLPEDARVAVVHIPSYEAELVYEDTGAGVPSLLGVIAALTKCSGYSKIAALSADGCLSLAVALGNDLQLANVYEAPDFTTAEYFIFAVMKCLQLNPEVSVISLLNRPSAQEEMSLYRYFKGVETI